MSSSSVCSSPSDSRVSAVLGGVAVGSLLGGLGYVLFRKPWVSSSSSSSFSSSAPHSKPKQSNPSDLSSSSRPATRESELASLAQENARLRRLVSLADVTEVDAEEKKSQSTHVPLTASEVETIRAYFDLFDEEMNGVISVSEIRALHKKLGEPLTEDEAAEALHELDKKGRGEVNFEEFLAWWYDNHKGKQKGDRYTARFKLICSKITDEFNVERVVRTPVGKPESLEYRVVLHYKQPNGALKRISPWHDVPLYSVGRSLFNFICEVPKWTRGKFEIATGEPYNPIKQDVKNGKLRYLKHGDMLFNYGAFPRTWEDPKHISEETGFPGDNDPLDVFELGYRQLETGSITPVKVLGILALIDDGETDWKVITISINDPLAKDLNDIDDVHTHLPGAIDALREYLRLYKVWQGNPENTYAMRGEALPKDFAIRIIEHCHRSWQILSASHQTTVSKTEHAPSSSPSDASSAAPAAAASSSSSPSTTTTTAPAQ